MPVKLEWSGDRLGADGLYADVRTRADGIEYDYKIMRLGRHDVVSEPYQSKEDARQDCESEVRRLLREAGVEMGP